MPISLPIRTPTLTATNSKRHQVTIVFGFMILLDFLGWPPSGGPDRVDLHAGRVVIDVVPANQVPETFKESGVFAPGDGLKHEEPLVATEPYFAFTSSPISIPICVVLLISRMRFTPGSP